MGNSSSSLQAPVFLKSGMDTIDINAQGALANFLICASDVELDSQARPSDCKVLNHDTWEFEQLTQAQWQSSQDYVINHPAVNKSNEQALDHVAEELLPFVFNPFLAADYRDHIKESTEGKSILLLSLVVSPNNLHEWVGQQDDNLSSKRLVKVTEKTIQTEGHTWKTYTRLVCQPKNSTFTAAQVDCSYHRALMQLTTPDNKMHCGFTEGNALMIDGENGEMWEGSLTADDYKTVYDLFEKGCRGDLDASGEIREFCEETLTQATESYHPPDDTEDRFVVLLTTDKAHKQKTSLQLQSSLKKKTVDKIMRSKEKIPTSLHNARKMCDKQGSLLKHADKVYLAIANFQLGFKKQCIHAHKYE